MKIQSMVYLICTLAVMAAIFLFSSQPLSESYKISDIFANPVESGVDSQITNAAFENDQAKTDYLTELNGHIKTFVRKTAHGVIFAALAMFLYLFLSSIAAGDIRAFLAALVFCAVYAAGDELHQHFVPSRNASVTDIFIDTAGSLLMLLAILFIKKLINNRRRRKL